MEGKKAKFSKQLIINEVSITKPPPIYCEDLHSYGLQNSTNVIGIFFFVQWRKIIDLIIITTHA